MSPDKRLALALGFFDGVHTGHQALLRRTVERAAEWNMIPAVFTFDRSPREFVTGMPVPLLTSREEREGLLSASPVQKVITVPFDRAMMDMPWEDFVEMLGRRCRAGWLVAGHDFHFGRHNDGTPDLLREKSEQLGMGCDIIPAVTIENTVVSSSYIRILLERGDAARAARFLGRPYVLSGPVCPGKGNGVALGAPTLNLTPPPGRVIPAHGVYLARVTATETPLPALVNIGVRPTVDDSGKVTVESCLLDRVPVRPESICVEFLRYLRPEQRFATRGALRDQIARDISEAREYFSGGGYRHDFDRAFPV